MSAIECPHCGRLVAEQVPGGPILCPACGSSSPNLETWNRRAWASAGDRAQLVAVAAQSLPPVPDVRGEGERFVVAVLQRVAELPDRSSPDDWPEAMLVTHAELERILTDELSTLRARLGEVERERIEVIERGYFAGEARKERDRADALQAKLSAAEGELRLAQGECRARVTYARTASEQAARLSRVEALVGEWRAEVPLPQDEIFPSERRMERAHVYGKVADQLAAALGAPRADGEKRPDCGCGHMEVAHQKNGCIGVGDEGMVCECPRYPADQQEGEGVIE